MGSIIPPRRKHNTHKPDHRTKQFEKSDQLKEKIKDLTVPVESFADELLEWMKKPVCSYEPYARLVRCSLNVSIVGRHTVVGAWVKIFPRIERLLEITNERGSHFAKVIMNETVAHRYVDYWLHTRHPKYEQKMKECYLRAYEHALAGKYYKNIDSTLYWLAIAHERARKFEEASYYFCKVANRKGPRFNQKMHKEKITEAEEKCHRYREHHEENIIT